MYKTDIQIIMDFVKLSHMIDNPMTMDLHRTNAIQLQGQLLKLLPRAKNSRTETIYKNMKEIYEINTTQPQ